MLLQLFPTLHGQPLISQALGQGQVWASAELRIMSQYWTTTSMKNVNRLPFSTA
jgi:hypothetical protein